MASADARKEAVEARRPPWLGKGPRVLMMRWPWPVFGNGNRAAARTAGPPTFW